MKDNIISDIIRQLYQGCTCYHHKITGEILYEDYILIHHYAHAIYGDRCSGSSSCPSYFMLLPIDTKLNYYDIVTKAESVSLLYLTGRMNKSKMKLIRDTIFKLVKESN
jgi:hypothetical protein